MVRKKRFVYVIVALLSISMLCSVTAFAAESDIPDATSQFYINDFADIISDDIEKEMQEKAVALAESSDGIQVVVTTVKTIGNEDPVYYTVDMYNKYEIGKNNMGVLIMLSVETRDIQIRVGDNMTKYLSDRKSGEIIDNYGIPYFKNDNFETGLYEMQNATIEHITSKVQTTENEVAVTPTDVEKIKDDGIFGKILKTLGTIGAVILSYFGGSKFLEKRGKKKKKEEIARIEESELVQSLRNKIKELEEKLTNVRHEFETAINAKEEEITSITAKLNSAQKNLHNLEERQKRAIMAYPDLNGKIDAIFDQEKEEADKRAALEVENHIRTVITFECTRHNLYRFTNACDAFKALSDEQKKYVPTKLVDKVNELQNRARELQRRYEEEERIRRNREQAEKVQSLILGALECNVTRHSLSNLTSTCHAYENLTNDQKKYVTADVESLYARRRKAKRLQEEYEEEKRRLRRMREEEEHRRREREQEERRRRDSYGGSSFGGGNHSGFGGHSSGHGAGGKF